MDRKQAKLPAHKAKGVGNDVWGDARLALAKRVAVELERLSVVWFLDGGTLLGAYRMGDLLPQDDDFDTAIYLPDYQGAQELAGLERELRDALGPEYAVRVVTSYAQKLEIYDPTCEVYLLPSAHYLGADFHVVTVDIQVMTDRPDGSVGYLHNMLSDVCVPKDAITPVGEITCAGALFRCPHDIVRFLGAQYGYLGSDAEYDPVTKRYVKISSGD